VVFLFPPAGRAARRFAPSLACQPPQTAAADPFPASFVASSHANVSIRLLGASLCPSSPSFFLLFPLDRELLLPAGGRIIVHEMLFNAERTGPFGVAAFNMVMLTYLDGEQYSGREIAGFFSEAGFTDIQVTPTFGYWSIVAGRKT
jgi:hypothetical protein